MTDSKVEAKTSDTENQSPLLNKEIRDEAEKNMDISLKQATIDSSKIAGPAILGSLFHPIYSIVNNIVLGHGDDETPLAGLGLGSLTVGITGLSLGICFAFGVGTFMSQEFGRKNFRNLHVYRNRALFLNTCVFIILFIPTLFINQIYEAIGQDPEVAAYGA